MEFLCVCFFLSRFFCRQKSEKKKKEKKKRNIYLPCDCISLA